MMRPSPASVATVVHLRVAAVRSPNPIFTPRGLYLLGFFLLGYKVHFLLSAPKKKHENAQMRNMRAAPADAGHVTCTMSHIQPSTRL
jgi:hypothetical protein